MMRFTTFFFDLDETLYPASAGLWSVLRNRITAFMQERMGFPLDEIPVISEKYFHEYGTTLRGLQANHNVNMDDYLAFVHDVPLEQYLHPDPKLRRSLESIPARKYIFTNADCAHAARVTKALDLYDLFEMCIDVHAIAPYCKPMPESFRVALELAGNPDPHKCVMLDDQGRITRAARAMGMYTVLVGKSDPGFEADEALEDLSDLPMLVKYWRI